MTALTTDINRIYEHQDDKNAFPVAAEIKIYEGSLLSKSADGYAQPLVAGEEIAGFSLDNVDNTQGSDGEKMVNVKAQGKVSLFISGLTAADVGKKVYASDDNTFTLTETGNSTVGKVIRFEKADYGIVAFNFFI